MKKIIILFMTLVLLCLGCASATSKKESISSNDSLDRIISTLLLLEIQQATDEFYEPYFSALPGVDAIFTVIKSIVTDEYRTHHTIIVETEPFLGAHANVGRDQIAIGLLATGTVKIIGFQHLENYTLPPNL